MWWAGEVAEIAGRRLDTLGEVGTGWGCRHEVEGGVGWYRGRGAGEGVDGEDDWRVEAEGWVERWMDSGSGSD